MEDMAALSNPESVRERIDSDLEALENLADSNRARADIIEELIK